MRAFTITVLFVFLSPAFGAGSQSAEEIQEQMHVADGMVITGVTAEFATPLKVFQKYYANLTDGKSVASVTATYQCLTAHAIEALFETFPLDEETLKRIAAGQIERDERDHQLVEFRFTRHQKTPSIVFSATFSRNVTSGRETMRDTQLLQFVRTNDGWRIDKVEELPVW
jgi:hypothetical protein